MNWRLYKVVFAKPIDKHLVADIEIASPTYRKTEDAEPLYVFTKEAYEKKVPNEILDRQLALSRHIIAALLVHNDTVVNTIRRELRRVVEVTVKAEEIEEILKDQVIKRDALDGQEAEQAARLVNKREDRSIVKKSSTPTTTSASQTESPDP